MPDFIEELRRAIKKEHGLDLDEAEAEDIAWRLLHLYFIKNQAFAYLVAPAQRNRRRDA